MEIKLDKKEVEEIVIAHIMSVLGSLIQAGYKM